MCCEVVEDVSEEIFGKVSHVILGVGTRKSHETTHDNFSCHRPVRPRYLLILCAFPIGWERSSLLGLAGGPEAISDGYL